MSRIRRTALAVALAAAALGAGVPALTPGAPGGAVDAAAATTPRGAWFDVLVFTRTNGYRHASIPVGIATLQQLGDEHGFSVVATEDPAAFEPSYLARFEAIIFLNTVGDVLDEQRQKVVEDYVRGGGGFVGIHAAADTEHDWVFYDQLVGTHFKAHPLEQFGTFVNEAPTHPAVAHLDARFTVFDEFYSFKTNPRKDVNVLLSIDESSYGQDPNTTYLPGSPVPPTTGVMGDHPMSWCHDNVGGRSFYTALGHEVHLYALPWFRRHLLGGILTATRRVQATCTEKPAATPVKKQAKAKAKAKKKAKKKPKPKAKKKQARPKTDGKAKKQRAKKRTRRAQRR